MVKLSTAVWRGLAAGVVALASSVTPASAAPTAAQILNFKPRQDGIAYTTPEADKVAECKVELVKGRGKGSGWLLRDSEGKPVRVFFDTNDDNKIDVWSYYKDGVEVFREIDSDFGGKPNQYRWLNGGGCKWGVDADRDGRIDGWKAITPEEVSQEVVAALTTRDLARLQSLMLTAAELKELALPEELSNRIVESMKGAQAKFTETAGKLGNLGSKVNWVHLETGLPQCIPADRAGGRFDVLRHQRGTVLVEANGKNEWVQTGEMLLVGGAWKLTEAPGIGAAGIPSEAIAKGTPGGTSITDNPKLAKFVEELTKMDREYAAGGDMGGPATTRHHLRRAKLLEDIIAEVKPTERDPWIRQLADSFSTAAQSSKDDTEALSRLREVQKQLVASLPGSNLTAYVTFREMQADYARKIQTEDFAKAQTEWLDRLGKFVAAFPKADDTPDALLQCGMVSEFLGKDVEAKNWYAQLVKSFPDKPQSLKANGAVARLELEGKAIRLAGPTLDDPNSAYDIEKLAGKVVVIYYWASWNTQSVGDFAKLKLLLAEHGAKGVELVCVNLDNTAAEAKAALQRSPAPGTHLHQQGGLESQLATQYGVMVLPNLFLVGKDGKVVSTKVQINSLEDEVKKLVK